MSRNHLLNSDRLSEIVLAGCAIGLLLPIVVLALAALTHSAAPFQPPM